MSYDNSPSPHAVDEPALSAITPAANPLLVGATQQLTVTGTYSDGTTADLTCAEARPLGPTTTLRPSMVTFVPGAASTETTAPLAIAGGIKIDPSGRGGIGAISTPLARRTTSTRWVKRATRPSVP